MKNKICRGILFSSLILTVGCYPIDYVAAVTQETSESQSQNDSLLSQYNMARSEYLKIRDEYESQVNKYNELKKEKTKEKATYESSLKAFNAAKSDYQILTKKYNKLKDIVDGFITDQNYKEAKKMLAEGSDFLNQYNIVKTNYEEVITPALTKAKTDYAKAQQAITEFNNHTDVKTTKVAYTTAKAKYDELKVLYEQLNTSESSENEQIYKAANDAYEKARNAKSDLELSYKEIDHAMSDYPLANKTSIDFQYLLRTFPNQQKLLNDVQVWTNNNLESLLSLTEIAKEKLALYDNAMQDYELAYTKFMQSDVFPEDGTPFVSFTNDMYEESNEILNETKDKLNSNFNNVNAMLEIYDKYKVLIDNYGAYLKDLSYDVSMEDTYGLDEIQGDQSYYKNGEWLLLDNNYWVKTGEHKNKYNEWNDFWQMMSVSIDKSVDDIDLTAMKNFPENLNWKNIKTQQQYEELLNYYENHGLNLLNMELAPYAKNWLSVADEWKKAIEDYQNDVNRIISDHNATFSMDEDITYDGMSTLMSGFTQSTKPIDGIGISGYPVSNNSWANTIYFNKQQFLNQNIRWNFVESGWLSLSDQIGKGISLEQKSFGVGPAHPPEIAVKLNWEKLKEKQEIQVPTLPKPNELVVEDIPNPPTKLVELDEITSPINPEMVTLPVIPEIPENTIETEEQTPEPEEPIASEDPQEVEDTSKVEEVSSKETTTESEEKKEKKQQPKQQDLPQTGIEKRDGLKIGAVLTMVMTAIIAMFYNKKY